MKLWDARFNKIADQRLNDFNSSIHFDQRFYAQDIKGSIAHVTMLSKQNIISIEDKNKIIQGLNEIKQEIENGQLEIDLEAEDIHMFIESELTKRIGDAGKRLHTARSRNDQVALDLRLYAIDEMNEIIDLIKDFIQVILHKAKDNTETIMSGYTHMQRAQPITFAHYLMAYVEMFIRDIERLEDTKKRTKVLPLGSGALATTTYPIDREYTKELLDFHSVSLNSLDGVSDRDFAIEFANALSILMMHLSRMSEEIILWCSHEFKYIELDDAFATGSSIMPQKKNPDICELIRGKSGRVIGDLSTLLIMMKGLPLAYNKDMQEDKEALFDAIDTTKACLVTITPMLDTMKVNKENMLKAANEGFINATDLADYLTKKGMPFRDAYKITGQLVNYCIQNNQVLETLSIEEYKKMSELFDEDVYQAIDLKNCVYKRNVIGGPSPIIVKQHIQFIENKYFK